MTDTNKTTTGELAESPGSMTIQEAFSALEQILEKLERGNAGLEESFAIYQDGLRLIRHCHGKIDGIEKQLVILQEEQGQ